MGRVDVNLTQNHRLGRDRQSPVAQHPIRISSATGNSPAFPTMAPRARTAFWCPRQLRSTSHQEPRQRSDRRLQRLPDPLRTSLVDARSVLRDTARSIQDGFALQISASAVSPTRHFDVRHQWRSKPFIQVSDTLTWVKGAHSLSHSADRYVNISRYATSSKRLCRRSASASIPAIRRWRHVQRDQISTAHRPPI